MSLVNADWIEPISQLEIDVFRESLSNNDTLLRSTLRDEIIRRVAAKKISPPMRKELDDLLTLSWLKEGHLAAAMNISTTVEQTQRIITLLQHFSLHEFSLSELSHIRHDIQEHFYLNPSTLIEILECLEVDATHQISEAQERKMNLLIAGLPSDSRALWRAIQSHLAKDHVLELELFVTERSVCYRGQKICLNSKKSLFQLLNMLAQSSELTLEQAVAALWQAQANESYFARLRRSTRRLNDILCLSLPIKKAVYLTSRQISLSPTLRLCIRPIK